MVRNLGINTYEQRTLVAVPAVFLCLAFAAVGMRYWTVKVKGKRFYADDYILAFALFMNVGCFVAVLVCVLYGGLGSSVMTLQPDAIDFVFRGLMAISMLWGTTVACVQAALLSLFLRFFSVVKWHRYTCYFGLGLVGAWWIMFFIAMLTNCIPLEKFWRPQTPGTCFDMKAFSTGSGLAHVFIDIFILSFSLPIIWQLKTSVRNRISVTIACTLGLFATACGFLRIGSLFNIVKYDAADFTYSAWLGVLFQLLENSCGILCACMPMFPMFLKRMNETGLATSLRRVLSAISLSSLSSNHGRSRDASRATSVERSIPSDGEWKMRKASQSSASDSNEVANSSTQHITTIKGAEGVGARELEEVPNNRVKITSTWDVQAV